MTSEPPSFLLDRHGRTVTVGTRVRVVGLPPEWERSKPPRQWADLRSMIGEVFEVYELDEWGQAWVEKTWPTEAGGELRSHSVGLDPHEMEVAEPTES